MAIVGRDAPDLDVTWTARVVEVVRRTRCHPDLAVGSSVRGALDTAAVASSLLRLRGETLAAAGDSTGLDAALVALSGRVRVRDGSTRRAEDVIAELWRDVFAEPAPDADRDDTDPSGDAGKARPAPAGPADG